MKVSWSLKLVKVLFVCLGNICRSPTAEGVFRQRLREAGLAQRVQVDSAATSDWQIGQPPDGRTCCAARRRGYRLEGLRARQVRATDFEQFDLILAMDENNLAELQRLSPPTARAELDLFLRRYRLEPEEVPDPYYLGEEGFEQVLDLIEQASAALLGEVRSRL